MELNIRCSSSLSVAETHAYDQINLGQDRVYLGYCSRSQSITEDVKAAAQSRNHNNIMLDSLLIHRSMFS